MIEDKELMLWRARCDFFQRLEQEWSRSDKHSANSGLVCSGRQLSHNCESGREDR